ncbi:hypothetical protein C2S51_027166 [Perilla frutescens var. frutescens]|nr:hypothetical protein C2S51_027166 [Perilla frutescens var. frutescens]
MGWRDIGSENLELSEKCLQNLVLKHRDLPAALVNYVALFLIKSAHIWTNLANAHYLICDYRTSGKCLEKCIVIVNNAVSICFDNSKYYACPSNSRLENWIQIVWPHDMLWEFTELEMLKDPRILMNNSLGVEMRWLSVLREEDPVHIEPPIAWADLALVLKAQHEIAQCLKLILSYCWKLKIVP